MYNNVFQLW